MIDVHLPESITTALSSFNNDDYNQDLLHLWKTNNHIHLTAPTERQIQEVSILNVEGKVVFNQRNIQYSTFSILKDAYAHGVYILSVQIGHEHVFKKIFTN